jgi:hypothetical protein
MASTMARDGKLGRDVFPFAFFNQPFGVAGHQQLRAWQTWGSRHQQRDYDNKSNENHVCEMGRPEGILKCPVALAVRG